LAVQRELDIADCAVRGEDVTDVVFIDVFGEFLNNDLKA
jgi:hypothetical protein